MKKNLLRPIVNTIIMIGRQEIPFWGTSDFGRLRPNDIEPMIKDGNFREILQMRIRSGDSKLKNQISPNKTHQH